VFTDADRVPRSTELETDLCVIGAGAAGITIARAFLGSATRVVVLEGGDLAFDRASQELYAGPDLGLPYFPLDTPRLRMFGGTTNHWAGVCRPFDTVDYERRPWIPYSGWPFGADEIDPYYERAVRVIQLDVPGWETDRWIEADGSQPLPLGDERIVTRVDQIVPPDRRSFAALYGDELRSSDTVDVLLRANVTEIERDEEAATIRRVQVATLTENRFSVRARVFVLAAGGIENARMLLVSRGRSGTGIGNEHDLVGRFFQEHPRFLAGVMIPASPSMSLRFYEERTVGSSTIQPRLALARSTQEAEELSDVQNKLDPVHDRAFERAAVSSDADSLKALRGALADRDLGDIGSSLTDILSDMMTWRDVTLPGSPLPVPYPDLVGELMRRTPSDRQALIPGVLGDVAGLLYQRAGGAVPVDSVVLTARFEPVPNPDSRVVLVDELDELGVPRAGLDWRLSRDDRHSVRRTMEIFAAEVGRAGLGRVNITFDEAGDEWPADLVGGYHLVGTTRMHDDPRQGVVDRDGRVHGTANLFIAGSSIFPTSGSGNPTMLLVALALRLSDHLRAVAL
jgi:choline dehydrogenase-like flavoprotein